MSLTNKDYYKVANKKKVKKLGQFFTPEAIAVFMKRWVLSNEPKTILDPAVGNGVFLTGVGADIKKVGYDIDPDIIAFFRQNGHMDYEIRIEDFLIDHWDEKYDSIICNPPYNKFQTLDNREEVYEDLKNHLKIPLSGYSNQYVLFLLKSIKLLNTNGRLAFIIPNEFLNTGYGKIVKKFLIDEKCLKAILSFDNSKNIFEDALTTACILLVEKSNLNSAYFAKIESYNELDALSIESMSGILNIRNISYSDLQPNDKWQSLFEFKDSKTSFNNLVPFRVFAKVKRGIATGDNDYFVFNKSKIEKYGISNKNLIPCAIKCVDFKKPIFTQSDFQKMKNKDISCYIFDGSLYSDANVQKYIQLGEKNGVNKKYLTSHRVPWYSMELKEPSQIWVNVFSRQKLKIVRNIANIKNLTTFHSIYLNVSKERYTNILFCYLLTNLGQSILYENKRSYGGGLDKFEPNDLNEAMVLNFDVISSDDLALIENIYQEIVDSNDINNDQLSRLESLYLKYLRWTGDTNGKRNSVRNDE